jgi:diguanylate cyclase (GGDEF)-like protein
MVLTRAKKRVRPTRHTEISMGRGLLTAAVALGATGPLVALAGGGQAFWLAVPIALALAARARNPGEAAAVGVLTTVSAALPTLTVESLGPAPSLPAALVVVGGSVLVLERVQARLEGERAALLRSALTDPLTGVANRRALAERVEYEVRRHARLGHPFAVVVLDLDGFKRLNDRFGHDAGDEALVTVAQALRDAVRDQDTVARLGGDEFCVLAPETGLDGAEHLADRICEAVRRATTGMGGIGASAGVGVFPDDGETPGEVLRVADAHQLDEKRRRTEATRRAA